MKFQKRMKRFQEVRSMAVICLLLCLALLFLNRGFAFGGYSNATEGDWYNASWHYRMRLEINATVLNRIDYPIETNINFSDLLPTGTFDNNSLRIFEYNESGKLLHEIPSQFDVADDYNKSVNAVGELIFILNGTTPPGTKRVFYVYYDIEENGLKDAPSYTTNLTSTWDGQIATANNTKLNIRIDTNRAEYTSGLYYVAERESFVFVPVLMVPDTDRTAEYLEYFNGTHNTTFDLRGNATLIRGPVRITIRQEGPEVEFGNVSATTNVGRIVKKYYIYNKAGPESMGSFIKVSQEFFSNASDVNRSNSKSGALALDLQRSFLSQDLNPPPEGIFTNPNSWVWASDSGGSVAGLVNINGSYSGYNASNNSDMGRIGLNLANTIIASGTSIKETALLYFGRGGSDAVSEFLDIMNETANPVSITRNLTEKWNVITTPAIDASIYNRNETITIRGNVSSGDAYDLTVFMNATLDMGTPSASDDISLTLYDDGTHGDGIASDRVFTSTYTFGADATVGQWVINFSTYGNSTNYLNSSMFYFNITDIYFVNITIHNPTGMIGRQIFANVTVRNFNQTIPIYGANISCIFNNTEVVNKTDLGNGNYSINFTAPSFINVIDLFCNATKSNNQGNATKNFITEAPVTIVVLNVTPSNFTIYNITLETNATFSFAVNATNIENGISRNLNMTLELLSGWSENTTLENCGDIGVNASCIKYFDVTVPNATVPGIYTINATAVWINPDQTQNINRTEINITVVSNPRINIFESMVSGIAADGTAKNVTAFTVRSVGNDVLADINFSCVSGTVCSDFNVSFSPPNITSIVAGDNKTIFVFLEPPLFYSPGNYTGLINASSGNISDTVTISVIVQNTTNLSMDTQPANKTINNITQADGYSFELEISITNKGNSSARNVTINLSALSGWAINSTLESCGNLTSNQTCSKNFTVSVPNGTLPGNYAIYLNYSWIDLNGSVQLLTKTFPVSITLTPILEILNTSLTGTAPDGQSSNPFNLTLLSRGNANVTNVSFNCTSGDVCMNFTVSYDPPLINSIIPGTNQSVNITVGVPANFQAGNYTGIMNVSSDNSSHLVNLTINVPSNKTWLMSPVFCQRSEFPDEGKVCDVTVNNTGNDFIDFNISVLVDNKTTVNATNFTIAKGGSFAFGVFYNITGFSQGVYNSIYNVSTFGSIPGSRELNISLLPYLPPEIVPEPALLSVEQGSELVIYANITDVASSGISFVLLSVRRPNGTIDIANMTLINQSGNFSRWMMTYANVTNNTFGNTSLRGLYNVTIFSGDNIGNIGNSTANFTTYVKLNVISRTLSSIYYQADSATIYYSVRDALNSGVGNVTATFRVLDQNSTLIYSSSRVTESDGTFEPLPVFTLTSDAPIGNYTLEVNSSYTDPMVGVLVNTMKNYTFQVRQKTITVTGLFADIETAVVWFPNNVMRFNMLVYDGEGKPIDPSTLNLTVYDPAQNLYFTTNLSAMTRRGLGFYAYSYAMPTNTATGMYLAVVNLSRDTLETMKLKAFRVAAGGPYDVRLTLANNEVERGTPLDYTITIENKGEVTQDVLINYTIVGLTDNLVYFSSSEAVLTPAFTNQSFTRSAFIFSSQPLGNYRLDAVVKYDNTQPEINVSTTFAVIASRRERPPAPNATNAEEEGGGVIRPPVINITNVEAPEVIKSLVIEKYTDSVKMYPGFKRLEYVTVRNTGKDILYGISLSILGIPSTWFNITPTMYRDLTPGNITVFVVEYNIPSDATVGDYRGSLIATTPITSDQKSLTISILRSLSDLLQKEIESLKKDMKTLLVDIGVAKNQGKNVEDVMAIADQADQNIQKAEFNFNLNNTETTLTYIKESRVLLEQARNLLNQLESVKVEVRAEFPWLLILLVILLAALLLVLFLLKRKKKLPAQSPLHLRHIFSFLEKMRRSGGDQTALMRERENAMRMLSVLESEKSEGIVSDNAYREMKKSLDSKLSGLEKKIEHTVKRS